MGSFRIAEVPGYLHPHSSSISHVYYLTLIENPPLLSTLEMCFLPTYCAEDKAQSPTHSVSA